MIRAKRYHDRGATHSVCDLVQTSTGRWTWTTHDDQRAAVDVVVGGTEFYEASQWAQGRLQPIYTSRLLTALIEWDRWVLWFDVVVTLALVGWVGYEIASPTTSFLHALVLSISLSCAAGMWALRAWMHRALGS